MLVLGEALNRAKRELKRWEVENFDPERVTCVACRENDECEYAFDLYSTDGDCLASK